MRKPSHHEALHSLDMIQQIITDATNTHGGGDCGGDCTNCPCSGEAPKSTKKSNDQETSDPCDKC